MSTTLPTEFPRLVSRSDVVVIVCENDNDTLEYDPRHIENPLTGDLDPRLEQFENEHRPHLEEPWRLEVWVPGDGWCQGLDEYAGRTSARLGAEHVAAQRGGDNVRLIRPDGRIYDWPKEDER